MLASSDYIKQRQQHFKVRLEPVEKHKLVKTDVS